MEKAKVYFCKEITPENIIKMYKVLNKELPGKVAVKMHSGEKGNKNYLKPGDVVVIPANAKHWHGAKKDSWFSHISIEVPGENTSNEWLEKVTDEQIF